MAGQTIDYDALAKQNGALSSQPAAASHQIDYAALAKQNGATSSTPASQQPAAAPAKPTNPPTGHATQQLTPAEEQQISQFGHSMQGSIGDYLGTAAKVLGAPITGLLHAPVEILDWVRRGGHTAGPTGGVLTEEPVSQAIGAASMAIAPEVAGKVGEVAGKTAAQVIPEGTAASLYQGALKPRITTPAADVRAMVQTGLENKIPVSEAGVTKLNSLLSDLNQKIQEKTSEATQRGVTVDPHRVAERLLPLEQRLRTQVNPEGDLADIAQSSKEFLRQHGAEPERAGVAPKPTGLVDAGGKPILDGGKPPTPARRASPIPADEAHAIKVGTYQKLSGKYGEVAHDALIESQKALARGVKEELNAQIPELADALGKEGGLFDLKGPLETAVNKAVNQQGQGIGFHDATTGAAAGVATGSAPIGVAAGVMRKVLSDPAVRSRLAIAINQAKRANPGKWGAPDLAASTSRVNGLLEGLTRAAMASQSEKQQ